MAVTSGFFNSLNGDRKYNAEQMSALFDSVINDGVFANIGSAFMVTADSGNMVNIGIGRAWFNSTWVNNDAILPLNLDGSEILLDRIDAIVIEINKSEAIREGRIQVIKGTPSSSAERPTLSESDGVFQHPLAYIFRKAGSSAITQADITNMIGTSDCPYITGILQVQNVDKNVAQWESQFEIWFDGLQAILDDDVAASLAGQVLDLQERFEDLARDRAVYEPLQDNSNDGILDNNGQPILGSTSFVYGEVEVSGGGSSEALPSEKEFKIGDVLTSARTSPGIAWLLCNGEAVSREDYPELADLFPVRPDGAWDSKQMEGISTNTVEKIQYLNGQYIGIYSGANNGYNGIAYSDNPDGPWTITYLSEILRYGNIKNIVYVNGYYVVLAQETGHGSGSTDKDNYSAVIVYSTSLTGTWNMSLVAEPDSSEDSAINDLIYSGGYYIGVGDKGTQGRVEAKPVIYYSTVLNNGLEEEWGRTVFDSYSDGELNKILYQDGTYYAFGNENYDSDASGRPIMYYSTSPTTNSWTRVEISSDIRFHITDAVVAGDKIIFVENDSGSTQYVYTDVSTLKTGPFVIKTLLDMEYRNFSYFNGYYVFFGSREEMRPEDDSKYNSFACLAYSANIDGPFTIYDLNSNVGQDFTGTGHDGVYFYYSMVANGDLYTYEHRNSYNSGFVDSTFSWKLDKEKFVLPTITSDNWTRVYIKALE